MVHKNKKTINQSKQKEKISDKEELSQPGTELETDESKQDSDISDESSSTQNEISALFKQLETLERLQTIPKYEKGIPEFRRISENEKSEIIKKFKRKNLNFPSTTCNWAIRQIMRGIINNKWDTAKHKMKDQLSYNNKKKKTDPPVEINDTVQSTSQISTPSPSNETEKSTTNLDQPLDMDVTSPSRIPFTTLQYQNADYEIQDKDANELSEYSRGTQNSGRKLRNHASRMPAQTKESIETTRVISMEDNAIPNRGRSSKMSSKGKNN
ncbi:6515_t:CDS:2, partial [Dentiscutata erythropus]